MSSDEAPHPRSAPAPAAASPADSPPVPAPPAARAAQTSALLARAGFVHGFFTRQGGVSEGPFASLNCSPDVGDRAEHVRENLSRVAQALGLSSERVYVAAQVHDRGVVVLSGSDSPSTVARTAADAIVSSAPWPPMAGAADFEVGCGVRTADCVPILLADPGSGRVAAVHAGWRGVVREVIANAIEHMVTLGSQRAALLAAIGPHIGPSAFEVGDDVALELSRASSAEDVVQRSPDGKAHVHLARIVHAQLCAAGLSSERIEQVPGCTHRDAARYFSFRRDGKRSGRMLSVIVARALPAVTSERHEPPAQEGE